MARKRTVPYDDLVEAEDRLMQRQEAAAVIAEGLRLLRHPEFPTNKRDRMAVILENLAGAAAMNTFNKGALALAVGEVEAQRKFLRLRPRYMNEAA